jgi:hypothetical protein
MINWFRPRLAPLKDETRQHDHEIEALDREVAAARAAERESRRRLHSVIEEMGEQFALATGQMMRRVVNPNGGRR